MLSLSRAHKSSQQLEHSTVGTATADEDSANSMTLLSAQQCVLDPNVCTCVCTPTSSLV